LIEWLVNFTDFANSPELFRRWSAIVTVGALLQRRVYTVLKGSRIYPNFYTVLIGPPGTGKSQAVNPFREILLQMNQTNLSSARITKEKFFDTLAKQGKMTTPENLSAFGITTPFAAFVSEMSTFVKPGDQEFVDALTDMYDCPSVWIESTLGRGERRIENLFVSLLAGTTPSTLNKSFGAHFGQGFLSRINFVYSDEAKPLNLFDESAAPNYELARQRLKPFAALSGEVTWTSPARRAVQDWFDRDMEPRPTDPLFADYCARRSLHFLKLCTVFAASTGELLITPEVVEVSKSTLLHQEATMLGAVSAIGSNPTRQALSNIIYWLEAESKRLGGSVGEAALKKRLLNDIQPFQLKSAIDELVASGSVRAEYSAEGRKFIPIGKK